MIGELIWPQSQIDHIAVHHVVPLEVEDVCFGRPLILRARTEGKNPVLHVLGQTASGRHLFCVIIRLPHGLGYPVTARLQDGYDHSYYFIASFMADHVAHHAAALNA